MNSHSLVMISSPPLCDLALPPKGSNGLPRFVGQRHWGLGPGRDPALRLAKTSRVGGKAEPLSGQAKARSPPEYMRGAGRVTVKTRYLQLTHATLQQKASGWVSSGGEESIAFGGSAPLLHPRQLRGRIKGVCLCTDAEQGHPSDSPYRMNDATNYWSGCNRVWLWQELDSMPNLGKAPLRAGQLLYPQGLLNPRESCARNLR